MDIKELRINSNRFKQSHDEICKIGATAGGGVNRVALTDEDRQARDLFVKWLKEIQCNVSIDEMGNIFGERTGKHPELPSVMSGSHLDSQPNAGRFDGTLGVLAALEVLRTLHENDIKTERTLFATNWTNEEGCRFPPVMVSSGVWAGAIALEKAYQSMDNGGVTQLEALEQIGYKGTTPAKNWPLHAYYEYHIEQGPILEKAGITIGIPKGIVCLHWYDITIEGQGDHVGPTPMEVRRDALCCAAEMILKVKGVPDRVGGGMVATVGEIHNSPNSRNIIPEKVHFTIDIRSWDDDQALKAWTILEQDFNEIAECNGTTVQMAVTSQVVHAPFNKELVLHITESAEALGYSNQDIVSGAVHDASYINQIAPAAMIFVPSIGGRSHVEVEHTDWDDCVAGANVLLQSMLKSANEIWFYS